MALRGLGVHIEHILGAYGFDLRVCQNGEAARARLPAEACVTWMCWVHTCCGLARGRCDQSSDELCLYMYSFLGRGSLRLERQTEIGHGAQLWRVLST